jgi:hypothetical protein
MYLIHLILILDFVYFQRSIQNYHKKLCEKGLHCTGPVLGIWNCWCQLLHRIGSAFRIKNLEICRCQTWCSNVPGTHGTHGTHDTRACSVNSALSTSSTEFILGGPLHDTVLLIYWITTWESALDDYSDRVYWDAWTAQLKIEIDRADDLQNHWFVRSSIVKNQFKIRTSSLVFKLTYSQIWPWITNQGDIKKAKLY